MLLACPVQFLSIYPQSHHRRPGSCQCVSRQIEKYIAVRNQSSARFSSVDVRIVDEKQHVCRSSKEAFSRIIVNNGIDPLIVRHPS